MRQMPGLAVVAVTWLLPPSIDGDELTTCLQTRGTEVAEGR